MPENIRIIQADEKKTLGRFIMFPWRLYRKIYDYPNWVPPLLIDQKALFDPRKHPVHKHMEIGNFLALKNGRPAGRISAIIDSQFLKYKEAHTAYFGFFECMDDEDVAKALFDSAERWAASRGMRTILGPISPTPNQTLGLLLNDFDNPPFVYVPYNPEYYVRLIEKLGYAKHEDHYAYLLDRSVVITDKMIKVADYFGKRGGVEVRPIDMKKFKTEVEYIWDVWNSAWIDNSDFVPWTKEEFHYMAKDLKLVAVPQMAYLAFVKGRPAGICICIPNINEILIKTNGRLFPFGLFRLLWGRKRTKSVRAAIIGVKPEFSNLGIDALFAVNIYRKGLEIGYEKAEFSLCLEHNIKAIKAMENWGLKRYRTYRVYRKDISGLHY